MSKSDKEKGEPVEPDWGFEGKSRVHREERESRPIEKRSPAAPPPKPVAPAVPKHVMVIDDDTDVADVLTAILECNGYIVTTTNNAADALREIMVRDFDAIVCDIVMPKMPGDMFYLAVSKVKPHLCDRFLFITGHGGDVEVAAFLFRVQRPIVYKPVVMEDLVEAVFQVLAKNAGVGPASAPRPVPKPLPKLAQTKLSASGRPRRL